MRDELKRVNGLRTLFTATVARFGSKPGYKNHPATVTVLLVDVRDDTGTVTTDHLWVTLTKGFAIADIKQGDRVQFNARVTPYTKGYRSRDEDNRTIDYRLSHPTKIKVIRRNDARVITDQLPLLLA